MHKCKYCDKEFSSGHLLGSHVRSHTRRLVECEICHHRYGIDQINTHKTICLENEKDKHRTCKKCGAEFISDCTTFCSKSCANKSRIVSNETKEKLRQFNLGKTKTSREPRQCKYCGKSTHSINGEIPKLHCIPRCEEAKKIISENLSKANKGKTGGYRKGGGRGHGDYYKGIWMDSTWEIALAKRLDSLGISWERDMGRHNFSYKDEKGNDRKYFPDFYLPEKNLYLEVKGYWTSQTRHKMEDVKKRNQNLQLLVLESLEEVQNFNL